MPEDSHDITEPRTFDKKNLPRRLRRAREWRDADTFGGAKTKAQEPAFGDFVRSIAAVGCLYVFVVYLMGPLLLLFGFFLLLIDP